MFRADVISGTMTYRARSRVNPVWTVITCVWVHAARVPPDVYTPDVVQTAAEPSSAAISVQSRAPASAHRAHGRATTGQD